MLNSLFLNSNWLNNLVLNTTVNKDIYSGGDTAINGAILKIIKIVGGTGSLAFTLAVLIIALFIIFGSISSKKIGTVWVAFFSCLGGALLFFGAYMLAPSIAGMI